MKNMRITITLLSLVSAFLFSADLFAEEYTFDISEIEKKPYHIGGYAEFRPVFFGLDKDASLYKLKFYNRDEGSAVEEYNAKLQKEGGLEKASQNFLSGQTPITGNLILEKTRRQCFMRAFSL